MARAELFPRDGGLTGDLNGIDFQFVVDKRCLDDFYIEFSDSGPSAGVGI